MKPGPGILLQGPGLPELVSDPWWVWSVPDTAGYRVWGVFFFFLNLCWVLVVIFELLIVPCKLYFSDQGLNPGPLYSECGISATGPPGKSLGQGCLEIGFISWWAGLGPIWSRDWYWPAGGRAVVVLRRVRLVPRPEKAHW